LQEDFFTNLRQIWSRYSSQREIEELCFKAMIDSYDRVRLITGISSLNENGIRDKFVIDLEDLSGILKHSLENCIIRIIPESHNAHTRKRTDIEFFLPFNKRSLIFECKKLSSAERRYLNDGLLRFVELVYAQNEKDAAMVGFVVSKNLKGIIKKLKEMVGKFHIIRLYNRQVLGYEYSFQSLHRRLNTSEILISHLFFHFN